MNYSAIVILRSTYIFFLCGAVVLLVCHLHLLKEPSYLLLELMASNFHICVNYKLIPHC
jgi:hypothetical protein